MSGTTQKRKRRIASALITALILFPACAPLQLHGEETVGQHFRRVLAQIDRECREIRSGPYLDKTDPEYRRKVADTSCDVLKLEPRDWRTEELARTEGQQYPIPKRWLATPYGRFAHAIKLPPPHNEPKNLYRSGMTGSEYFQTLCRSEAGEFIFRRAEGVQGLRQDRPSATFPVGYLAIAFHTIEQGTLIGAHPERYLVAPTKGRYQYLDVRLASMDRTKLIGFRRFMVAQYRSMGGDSDGYSAQNIREEDVSESDASYGYTWRGIRRPDDWENGIYGLELIVFRVEPFQVFAVKRTFRRYEPNNDARDPRSVFARPCPQATGKRDLEDAFILAVLRPPEK